VKTAIWGRVKGQRLSSCAFLKKASRAGGLGSKGRTVKRWVENEEEEIHELFIQNWDWNLRI